MQRPQPTQPRRAELVMPRRQLVGQPLPVARARSTRARCHRGRRNVGVKHESQRRHALGCVAVEVGRVLDAWSRNTSGRPACSWRRRGSARDVVPARVLEVRVEQLLDAVGVERAAHARRPRWPIDGVGRRDVGGRGRARRHARRAALPPLAADLDEEAVLAVEELGERQIEAAVARAAPCPSRRRSRSPPASPQFTATTKTSLRRRA